MDFQYLGAAVLHGREQIHFVTEHGHGDVRTEFFQRLFQQFPMSLLLERVVDHLVQQRSSVVIFITDGKIPDLDFLVQRKCKRPSLLLCGQDRDFMSMPDQPVGLVRQHPLHPCRPVETGDVIDNAHITVFLSGDCRFLSKKQQGTNGLDGILSFLVTPPDYLS